MFYNDRVLVKTFPCHTDKWVISKVLGYLKEQGQRRPPTMLTKYKLRPSLVTFIRYLSKDLFGYLKKRSVKTMLYYEKY